MKLVDNDLPNQTTSLIPRHLASLHNARSCQRSSRHWVQPVQENRDV